MNNILLLSATDLEHGQSEIHGVPIHITGIGKINSANKENTIIDEKGKEILIKNKGYIHKF